MMEVLLPLPRTEPLPAPPEELVAQDESPLLQLNRSSDLIHSSCVFPFFLQYFLAWVSQVGVSGSCSAVFICYLFVIYLLFVLYQQEKGIKSPLHVHPSLLSSNPQHCPAPLGPHYWALSILTPLVCSLIRNKVVCLFYTYLTCRLRFAECHQSLPRRVDLTLIGGALNSAQMLLLWI